jgi:hypothetical protein
VAASSIISLNMAPPPFRKSEQAVRAGSSTFAPG